MAHETDDDELFEDDNELSEETLAEFQNRREALVQVTAQLLAAHLSHHGGLSPVEAERKALVDLYGDVAAQVLDMAEQSFLQACAEETAAQILEGSEEDEGELP